MDDSVAGSSKSIFDKIVKLILYINISVLASMMFLTVADVFLRYVFNRPIAGATELIELMMALFVPLSILYCAQKKSHICVEIVVDKLPRKTQSLVEIFTTLVTILFFFLMAWQNIFYVFEEFESNLTTSVLLIPTYPFVAPVAIMAAFLCLVLFSHLIHHILEVFRK